MIDKERERGGGHRERDARRKRERDRQTDRQTDRDAEGGWRDDILSISVHFQAQSLM